MALQIKTQLERSVAGQGVWEVITSEGAYPGEIVDSTAVPGVSYDYRAKLMEGQNESPYSAVKTVQTLEAATVPGQPTSLSANAVSQTQINLSWTAPDSGGSNITGYKIERKTGAGSWSVISANTGSAATSYSSTGLAAGTSYTYRVSAINAIGTGVASAEASATTQAAFTVPAKVGGLTAETIAFDKIALSWVTPANGGKPITGYKIERSVSGGAYSVLVANTGIINTSYTDSGLTDGVAYSYKVSAINSIGTGNASDPASATTADIVAPVITLLGGDLTIYEGIDYEEPGYTATDDKDGDISDNVVVNYGGLDPVTPSQGVYSITYNVQDSAGNAAVQKSRTVTVEVASTLTRNFQKTTTIDGQERLIDFYVPPNVIANPSQPDIPFIMFAHGNGESGFSISELRSGASYAKFVNEGDDYPYVVISPQSRDNTWTLTRGDEILAYAKTLIPGLNMNKVGVAGWSGGELPYIYLNEAPERVAVAVMFANVGSISSDKYCSSIADAKRVWIIGASDDPLSGGGHINYFNGMKNCPNFDPSWHRMTYYQSGGHDSVTRSIRENASGGPIVAGNGYSPLSGSDLHNFIMAAWDQEAPSVPTNLAVTEKTGLKISISWDASTDEYAGVRGYIVNFDGVDEPEVEETTFTKFELSPGTEYDFKIKAIDHNGNVSAYSTVLSVTTEAITDPNWNPDMTSSDLRISTADGTGYTKSGTALISVIDKSSRGGNTINIGNSPEVIAGSGSKELIHFRSANFEKLSIPDANYFDYTDSQMLFAVCKVDLAASDDWATVISKGDSNHDIRKYGASSEICSNISGLSPSVVGRTGTNNSTYYILVSNFKDGVRQFRINGTLAGEETGIALSITPNGNPIAIASTEDKGRFTELYLHEAIVAQGKDLAIIEKYEGWAAHTYGLTSLLPAGHPYKTDPPPSA